MKTNINDIYLILKDIYKDNLKSFLNYNKDYEFLFAVILSSQTTDKKVNEATKNLFNDLKELKDYNEKNKDIILKDIKSLGLYKNKTNNIIFDAQELINKYEGRVPSDRNLLLTLKGVGYKTSGVILNELYKTNFFPVDTHVLRLSNRLGLFKGSDANKCEIVLEDLFHNYDCFFLHHAFILFGRNICNAINPKCKECKLSKLCLYHKE